MERYMLDLINGLDRSDQQLTYVTTKVDPELVETLGITVHKVPNYLFRKANDYSLFKTAHTIVENIENSCSIATSPMRNADIAVCGGNHPGYLSVVRSKRPFTDKLQLHMEKIFYAHAKHVVAHSERMRGEILEYFDTSEDSVTTIYPPTDTNRFRLIDDEQRLRNRKKLGFADDQVVFLFPSTGHTRKGLPLLAEVFSTLPANAILVVAGAPINIPVPANVRSLGYVSDMPTTYSAADFTTLASTYEPFGLVAPKSILCGTPVIFSDNIGSIEVIEDEACRLFSRDCLDTAIATFQDAIESTRTSPLRVREPLSALRYDPSPATHVKALLDIAKRLME